MNVALPAVCASLYRLPVLALYAWSWRWLIPAAGRPPFGILLRLRWIGEAVNSLLPVAQVGGDLTRARLLAARGVDRSAAGAAMVADLAVGSFTQALFGVAGLAALLRLRAGTHLEGPLAMGSLLALAGGAVFLGVLRFGTGRLVARLPVPSGLRARARAVSGGADKLDAAMHVLTHRPGALAAAAGWHLVGWFLHAGETWLVLALFGAPVSWLTALAIESLSSTARAAAFFVPAGLGVQEGAVVFLGRLLGVPLEAAVGLLVVKRARELAIGVPGLAAWAAAERAPLRRAIARLRAGRSRSRRDA